MTGDRPKALAVEANRNVGDEAGITRMAGERHRWKRNPYTVGGGALMQSLGVMLLALVLSPIYQATAQSSPKFLAAQWLATQQNADGSWGLDQEIQPLSTTEAVRALAAIYQRNAAYHKGIAWLENHAVANVDYRARRLLAFAGRANQKEPDLAYLRSAVAAPPQGNNGWGLTDGYLGSPLETAIVLQAFASVGEQHMVSSALAYVKDSQLTGSTKGWTVSHEASNDASVTSDPISTSLVVQALLPYAANDATLNTPIANAVATLQSQVTVSSPALTQAHAALALLQENSASLHGQLLLAALRASQISSGNNSGSWGGDIYTTAVALRALALAGGGGLAPQEDLVFIPDVNLRKAINQALGKNDGDAITKGELARLTELIAKGLGIKDLTGLEWAVNLEKLDISDNQVTDITPLKNLTKLDEVSADDNPLSETDDSDSDGAYDAEEAFAGTDPLKATDHPVFHVDADPLDLETLKDALGNVAGLTDAWHALWEDVDADGDLDAVVYVHGADEQWIESYGGATKGHLWLFENVAGAYTQRQMTTGEDQPNGDVSELFVFDYNHDGLNDLLMVLHPVATTDSFVDTNSQHRDLVLFQATSTTTLQLTDVTQTAGLPGPAAGTTGTRSAAVLDLNHDGYLDIFITSTAGDTFWQYDPLTSTYQDVMASTGLPGSLCCELVTLDIDNDGAVDLVAEGGANVLRLFKNDGAGSFTEMTNQSASSLFPLATLTDITEIVPADYDGDGLEDLVIFQTTRSSDSPVTVSGGTVRLVKNLSTSTQFDLALDTAVTGFESSGNSSDFSYGGNIGDLDNDGDLDFLIASQEGTDWTTLYRNKGDGSVTRLAKLINIRKNGNRAPALGDFNQDGGLDLLLPSGHQGGYTNYLYTNLETDNHYLDVKITGKGGTPSPVSGPHAVGARVKVVAGGVTQWQQVLIGMGRGHLLHFGLGTATTAEVTVYWPSGTAPTTTTVSTVDKVVSVTEP